MEKAIKGRMALAEQKRSDLRAREQSAADTRKPEVERILNKAKKKKKRRPASGKNSEEDSDIDNKAKSPIEVRKIPAAPMTEQPANREPGLLRTEGSDREREGSGSPIKNEDVVKRVKRAGGKQHLK